MPRVVSILLKVLLAVVLVVALAVVGALVALRVPSVQTRVAQRAASILTDKLGQKVLVGRVDVRPFSRVLLEGVQVLDRRGSELFYIGRAEADIRLFSVLDPSHLHVGKLMLDEPRFTLLTYAGQADSTTLDQFLGAVRRLVGPSDTTKVSKPFDFKIEAIGLRNGRFVLDDQARPREPYYGRSMDYAHMRIDSIAADISQIWLRGDTIHAQISQLQAVDTPSRTRLRELTADMTYSGRFWEFAGLNLRVGNSQLRNYLRFEYKHFLNFADFNDSVKVVARLGPSRVTSDDIAQFAPQPFMRELKESVLLSGEAKGYVHNFTTKNLDVRYGQNTRVVGNINVQGLPNLKESFVEMRLQPSVVDGRDIRRYIPASGWPYVQRLGVVRLRGQFLGFYNDFVANGAFQTALGSVVSDVNLKFKDDPRFSSYEGDVRTTGFQLGRLLGDESTVRDVTLNGRVQGVGFDLATARLTAKATVQSIWLRGYRFRNITTDGRFSRESFTGWLAANDPSLQFDADGSVDLNRRRQAFDVRARVRRADLRALGLTKQSLTVATTADVRFRGLRLDELVGRIELRNSRVSYQGRSLTVDTLDVLSERTPEQRRLAVRSEVLNLNATGDFDFTEVLRSAETLLTEYRLNFESNDAAIADYYRRKRQRDIPEYLINLAVLLKRPNPVLQLFVPQLRIANNTALDGSFRNGPTSILQLGGRFDTLQYDSVRTYNTAFEFNTSKRPYRPEVLAQANVTSERQVLPGLGRTENFYVEGVWDQERINFSTALAQTSTTNRAQINGALSFLPSAVQVVFRQSGVNLLGREWAIAPDNSVVISEQGKEFDVKHLSLSNGVQSISAEGFVSQNPSKQLSLNIRDLELATLSSLTRQNMTGVVNAKATVSGVYGPLAVASTLVVDSLRFDNTLIGDVTGRSSWDNAGRQALLDLNVLRDGRRVVRVAGTVAPTRAQGDQLNLTGVLDQAPVKLAEPFLNTLFRDLRGTAEGTLRLAGRLSAPHLTGTIDVTGGQLTFIYLGTTYTFADRIRFADDRISLNNIQVKDPLGNAGVVSGDILHDGFQNMRLALQASFRKLLVLSTTRKDNELYFGTAYATGTARVNGPADNLVVNVQARSEPGTRLSLPLDNAARAEQASYIRFVNRNFRDTTSTTVPVGAQEKIDLSGIRLNMNLEVTPDAYVEILLDESTGDVIRGTASGRLRLNIDTRGDFNMYGQIEIVRGAYNFTLQGLVNKEFVVRPGGTIAWNGDPLAGEMNVTAAYTQRTSLAPVLANNTAVVPVTAVINLTGPLLLPAIKLNLEFNDIPSSLEGDLAPFLSALRNDEQELNRQVFSLVVFRQLTQVGSFAVSRLEGGNNAFGNSLGQIISSQLTALTSQLDPNLEISFNFNGLSAAQLQALQVRLSYSFLNGRLRVTREGGFNNGAVVNTGAGTVPVSGANTSLIGDLNLEYYLRPDGKFRAKLRYETTPRDFNDLTNLQNQARAGVSLLHTEQFDSFTELFARKHLRRREVNARKAREVLNVDDDPRTNL